MAVLNTHSDFLEAGGFNTRRWWQNLEQLDPARCAHVVVDVQERMRPLEDLPEFRAEFENVAGHISRTSRQLHSRGVPSYYIWTGAEQLNLLLSQMRELGATCPDLLRQFHRSNKPEDLFRVQPLPGDRVLEKTLESAPQSSDVENAMARDGRDVVLLSGFFADRCYGASGRDFSAKYPTILMTDCTNRPRTSFDQNEDLRNTVQVFSADVLERLPG